MFKLKVSDSSSDGTVYLYHTEAPESISAYGDYSSLSSNPVFLINENKCKVVLAQLPNLKSLLKMTNDVQSAFVQTATAAVQLAVDHGCQNPTISFPNSPAMFNNQFAASPLLASLWNDKYSLFVEATLLGLYQKFYQPLQAREYYAKVGKSFDELDTLYVQADHLNDVELKKILDNVYAIEQGNMLARDVGGSDPERMSPQNCASFITKSFKDLKNVKITIINDTNVLLKEYPLLMAVSRASLVVERHRPCVVRLEYKSPDQSLVEENLYFSGKGVTYDTGGADLKVGGHMRSMSRDKCGASGVAGFVKTAALLNSKNVNIIAELGFVRNSIGADSFVSDEILTARSGIRLLIGNTDAEGRLVMCDILCKLKEEALSNWSQKIPSRLFTVATLTGHAIKAVGFNTALIDNGPAKMAKVALKLQQGGEKIGQGAEITSLRKEDFHVVRPGAKSYDVVQCNEVPSSLSPRGHQFPMAFLSVASGLSEWGLDSEKWLSYTHVDVAGSAEESSSIGWGLPKTTGAPVSTFAAAFLL